MKITISIPLVQYLYSKSIAFLKDGENLIIDDSDYIKLLKSLKDHQRTRFKINDNKILDIKKTDRQKEKKIPKQLVITNRIPKVKKVIPDLPKKITRPPAVYSNPDYKNMYL